MLGQGSWGTVYCGSWKGLECAVKTVSCCSTARPGKTRKGRLPGRPAPCIYGPPHAWHLHALTRVPSSCCKLLLVPHALAMYAAGRVLEQRGPGHVPRGESGEPHSFRANLRLLLLLLPLACSFPSCMSAERPAPHGPDLSRARLNAFNLCFDPCPASPPHAGHGGCVLQGPHPPQHRECAASSSGRTATTAAADIHEALAWKSL